MQISSFATHDKAVTGILMQAYVHFETQPPDESRYTRVIMQITEQASKQVTKGLTGQAKHAAK